MSYPNRLRVRSEYNPEFNPFAWCPLRELARRTGQDPSNLSRYKAGKLVLSDALYKQLLAAAYEYGDEQLENAPTKREKKKVRSIIEQVRIRSLGSNDANLTQRKK